MLKISLGCQYTAPKKVSLVDIETYKAQRRVFYMHHLWTMLNSGFSSVLTESSISQVTANVEGLNCSKERKRDWRLYQV